MNTLELESYRKAGRIAKKIKEYAKTIIKLGAPLNELAEKIESKTIELGGEVAFPVSLGIDDIAAHYTPSLDDATPASGLFKVDIGVHVDGFIADTAFTIDLTDDNEHQKIIKATQDALEAAQNIVKTNGSQTQINTIGKAIHETITKADFSPIRNLSGHSLEQGSVHAGITIPNYDNGNENQLGEGAFAIEPFATYGEGVVYEGAGSNIYSLAKESKPRDPTARKVLEWIIENKLSLPFSSRELEREFGTKARIAIKRLTEAGIISEYAQLIEKSHKPVTQQENTFIISKGKVEVTSD